MSGIETPRNQDSENNMSSEKGKVGLLNESIEESERASVAIEFNT